MGEVNKAEWLPTFSFWMVQMAPVIDNFMRIAKHGPAAAPGRPQIVRHSTIFSHDRKLMAMGQ